MILTALHHLSSKKLFTSAIVLFFIGVLIQYTGNYHYYKGSTLDKLFNYTWFHRNAVLLCYPFLCIGYLIQKHKIHERISLGSALLFSILGLSALLGEAGLNYYQEGRDGGFDNYLSLLMTCPFIFLLFTKINIPSQDKSLTLYASGIYFIHVFILHLLENIFNPQATTLTIAGILVSAACSYIFIKVKNTQFHLFKN